MEPVEDPLALRGWDARARIADGECAVARYLDRHGTAAMGERVVDEDPKKPREEIGVAVNDSRFA